MYPHSRNALKGSEHKVGFITQVPPTTLDGKADGAWYVEISLSPAACPRADTDGLMLSFTHNILRSFNTNYQKNNEIFIYTSTLI